MVHRVFLPLNHLPAEGRRQVVRMVKFLDQIHLRSRGDLPEKCAALLGDQFVAELLGSNLVLSRKVHKPLTAILGPNKCVEECTPFLCGFVCILNYSLNSFWNFY